MIDTLLRAARRILPGIGTQDVLRTYAGLSPYRDGSLRLEAETLEAQAGRYTTMGTEARESRCLGGLRNTP